MNNIQDEELDWSVRVALAHLGEVEERYQPYLFWLLGKADDPNVSIRVKTVRALKVFSSSIARDKLLEKLQVDVDSAVKALAALSLTNYNLNSIQRPLEDVVKTGDPESSLFALLAFSYLQKTLLPMPIEELGTRIKRWPPRGRVAAIRALSWFYIPENATKILTLLIDFLITDNELLIKREVVAMIGRFNAAKVSAEATKAMTALQTMTEGKAEDGIRLLYAVALVKLGQRRYLDMIQAHLIAAKEQTIELSMFVLNELDIELHNDLIPFLLDLASHRLSPKVQISVETLLFGRYWRDSRLIPYFRKCLASQNKVETMLYAGRLLEISKEGYKPVYDLLKNFLGEEPSQETINRYFH